MYKIIDTLEHKLLSLWYILYLTTQFKAIEEYFFGTVYQCDHLDKIPLKVFSCFLVVLLSLVF